MPVTVPQGVDVAINEAHISVKGTGGSLSIANNALVKVIHSSDSLSFAPANESREANAMSGTLRQLVNNMVVGVTKGFEKKTQFGWCRLQSCSPRQQTQFGCGLFPPCQL